MAKVKVSLPEGFKLKKGAPVKSFDRTFGEVDLRAITSERAEILVAKGYPHLEKVKQTD